MILQRSFSLAPESVIQKDYYHYPEVISINDFLLADADFVFIPFMTRFIVFIYVYSIKEDRSRIIEVSNIKLWLSILIFYNSVWNGIDSHVFIDGSELMCIYVSGNSLDTFEFRVCSHEYKVMKFTQISKKLLLIVSHSVYKLFDTNLGTQVWEISIDRDIENFDCSSRYFFFNNVLCDFSPEKIPEIKEWLYILFE